MVKVSRITAIGILVFFAGFVINRVSALAFISVNVQWIGAIIVLIGTILHLAGKREL